MVLLPVAIILDMQYLVECGEKSIWLRRVTNMTALGYEYDCVGLRRRIRKLIETSASVNRDVCVS